MVGQPLYYCAIIIWQSKVETVCNFETIFKEKNLFKVW